MKQGHATCVRNGSYMIVLNAGPESDTDENSSQLVNCECSRGSTVSNQTKGSCHSLPVNDYSVLLCWVAPGPLTVCSVPLFAWAAVLPDLKALFLCLDC